MNLIAVYVSLTSLLPIRCSFRKSPEESGILVKVALDIFPETIKGARNARCRQICVTNQALPLQPMNLRGIFWIPVFGNHPKDFRKNQQRTLKPTLIAKMYVRVIQGAISRHCENPVR